MRKTPLIITFVVTALMAFVLFVSDGSSSWSDLAGDGSSGGDENLRGDEKRLDGVNLAWHEAKKVEGERARFVVQLEKQREDFIELMRTSPQVALAKRTPLDEWNELSEELKPYFPVAFSARGDIELYWETAASGDGEAGGGIRSCRHYNEVMIGDEKLTALGADRGVLPVVNDADLAGVRIGDTVLLTDSPVVALKNSELDAARELFEDSANSDIDPMTGKAVDGGQVALIGGSVYRFQRDDLFRHVDDTLALAFAEAAEEKVSTVRQPFEWLEASGGGSAAGGGDVQATPYQADHINVLFVRVDFSDFAGAPISKADLEATLSTVNGKVDEYSYGAASVTYTVTDSVYRMPRTGQAYATDDGSSDGLDGDDEIHADASALASANYTLGNYDVIAVYFPNLGGVTDSLIKYGGLASVGGSRHWINGFNSTGVILHEFGHNYGLGHANYYDPSQSLGGTYRSPGSLEYGDVFDVMGGGGNKFRSLQPSR